MNKGEKMKVCKVVLAALALALTAPTFASASEDHNLVESCKMECPDAKTEHEAHKCMKEVVKKKKLDKKFRKSDCVEALREHEKHEKESGHKH